MTMESNNKHEGFFFSFWCNSFFFSVFQHIQIEKHCTSVREEQICEGARQRQMSVSGSLVPDDIHALRLQKTFLNLYNECAFFFF